MTICLNLLIVLYAFHVIRNGVGLSITGPADKNITEGMTVSIECQEDKNGVVFEFTHRNSSESVLVGECDFNVKNPMFYTGKINFAATHTITHINHTCILTILHLSEEQCGKYSCAELFGDKKYMNYTIPCNEKTADVMNTHTKTGTNGIIIGVIVGILCAAAIASFIFVIHRKRCNTRRAEESVATSTNSEHRSLVDQESDLHEQQQGAKQRNNHDDDVGNEDDVPDEARTLIDNVIEDFVDVKESTKNECEETIDKRDTMDECGEEDETEDLSESLINYESHICDTPDTGACIPYMLTNQSTELNGSIVPEGKRTDSLAVLTFGMNAEEAVSTPEKLEIDSRNNASLNNQKIREIIQTREMDQKRKDELLDILNIGTYKKSRNTFDRQHFGNQLLKGQLTRSQSVLNASEKET